MNKPLRKIILWSSAFALYLFLVALVFNQLLSLPKETRQDAFSGFSDGGQTDASSLKTGQQTEFSELLLPLGPTEARLPGHPRIWKEFLSAGDVDTEQGITNGFDGLQVVENIADFSENSVAELFLSGTPLQGFLQGRFFLLLNKSGAVQIIDLQKPEKPVLTGALPYQRVQQMEVRDDIAYLLMSDPARPASTKLIVADLKNPYKPVERSQLNLPQGAQSFFFLDHQLVVYSREPGVSGARSMSLYDLNDHFRLVPSNSLQPFLLDDFVQYGDYLVTTGLRSGLDVIDLSDPLQPDVVASVLHSDQIKWLTRRGDRLFAFGKLKRVYVMNFQEPRHPVLSSVVEEANYLAFFVTIGNFSYFFTENGYLRVFDKPPLAPAPATVVRGELLTSQGGQGFSLIGDIYEELPSAVSEVLTLPEKTTIQDKLFWHEFLVVLDDDVVQFFHKGQEGRLELKRKLKLSSAQRWLTASNQRLYVGGGPTIDMIGQDDLGQFVLSGQIDSPGKQSWDGLVVQGSLCVAAGKNGVFCAPEEQPDHLTASQGWALPRHLASLADVRLLASPGDNRVMASAGRAGLLNGLIDDNGQLHFTGFVHFSDPIDALALVGNFCLASTGDSVEVVDISEHGSLQNLGRIALSGVERFAVASSELWAGYVPEIGWQVTPAPHLVLPEEKELLQSVASLPGVLKSSARYRLALFNDHEVINVPGVFTSSAGKSGAADAIQ